MEILLDVDGVLADYVGNLCFRHWPNRNPQEFKTWDLTDHLNAEEREVWARTRVSEGFCRDIPWYREGRRFLYELRARTDQVTILTARDTRAPHWVGERDVWLMFEGVQHDQIIYCPTGKKHIVSGDMLIEDNVDTCNRWAQRHPACRALLLNRPWNTQYATEPNVQRCASYEDVLSAVDSFREVLGGPRSSLRSI